MTRVEFDFAVPADHPCLAGHFPGRPIVPGVLVLDHVFQALEQAGGVRVSHVPQARFTSPLAPLELAHVLCEVEGAKASFHVTASRGDAVVAIANGVCALSPPAHDGVTA